MNNQNLPISSSPSLTVVVAFEDKGLRKLAIRSLSRHNMVYDPYQYPMEPLSGLLDVPTYIIFMDFSTYQSIADTIIVRYQSCDLKKTPPLLVYGLDVSLYQHPLIFDALGLGTDECDRLYARTRRKAKQEEKLLCY